jgi:hypothetical protein
VSRRSFLKSGAAVGGTIALGGFAGRTRAQSAGIPTTQTLYQVRMVGQTSYEQFDRTGLFLVTPPAGSTGSQARDIALTSGNPQGAPEGGAIDFVTNTALRPLLDMGGSPSVDGAAIQVGSVQVDEASSVLVAEPISDQGFDLPPGVLPGGGLQVNIFTPRSGILASLYEINAGSMQIQFQGGNQIFGAMDLQGVSLTGADQARIVAQLAGTAAV